MAISVIEFFGVNANNIFKKMVQFFTLSETNYNVFIFNSRTYSTLVYTGNIINTDCLGPPLLQPATFLPTKMTAPEKKIHEQDVPLNTNTVFRRIPFHKEFNEQLRQYIFISIITL